MLKTMNYPDTYSKEEQLEMDKQFEVLLDAWTAKKDESDIELVKKAYEFAALAHKDARRKSGEPYIFHPIAVAIIVAKEIGMGTTSIVSALLHDVVEDTEYTEEQLNKIDHYENIEFRYLYIFQHKVLNLLHLVLFHLFLDKSLSFFSKPKLFHVTYFVL